MDKYRDFVNKSYFFVLRRTKVSPLSFSENMVYSYLTHRANYNEGASMTEINRETGIDRHRTLPQLCEGLATYGLIQNRDNKLFALPPTNGTAEWFHRQRNAKGIWAKQFQFFRYYPLSLEGRGHLTLAQNAVLWLLYSFWDGNPEKRFAMNLSRKGIATMLHLDRDTVANAISVFTDEGLIDVLRSQQRKQYFAVYLAPPTGSHLGWFKDQGKDAANGDEYGISDYLKNVPAVPDVITTAEKNVGLTTKKAIASHADDEFRLSQHCRLSDSIRQQEPEIAAQVDRALDLYGRMMLAVNFTAKETLEYWQLAEREVRKLDNPCGVWCCAVAGFHEFFEQVEAHHRQNRSSGKYGLARNTLGLLKRAMPERIRSLEQTLYASEGGWRDAFWYHGGAYIK